MMQYMYADYDTSAAQDIGITVLDIVYTSMVAARTRVYRVAKYFKCSRVLQMKTTSFVHYTATWILRRA